MALEVRGFNLTNKRIYIREVADTVRDRYLRRGIMIAAFIVLAASIYFRIVR